MYTVQHYVINFVSDLWPVGGISQITLDFASNLKKKIVPSSGS
jgi:hypothetical protein